METTSQKQLSRFARMKRALRKRWVHVCMIGVVWLLAVSVSARAMGPKTVTNGAPVDTSKFKFLHCDQCGQELPYNKDLDGKRCSKCPPPKTGFYVPTEASMKSSLGSISPWSKVYVAAFVETVLMLAVVTFVLYRPVIDPATVFYVVACPYCNQRLRYRAVSHGGQGACSRCKRLLRFPDEQDAVSEAELLQADEAAARAETRAEVE